MASHPGIRICRRYFIADFHLPHELTCVCTKHRFEWTVVFPAAIASQFETAFVNSAAFWNNVIAVSTVNSVTLSGSLSVQSFGCGTAQDFVFQPGDTIGGLVIVAEVVNIDGAGSVLGRAAPCIR